MNKCPAYKKALLRALKARLGAKALPFVVLDVAVELHLAAPARFTEETANLLLHGGRDEELASTVLEEVGAVVAGNEMLTHVFLHVTGHVVRENAGHAFRHPHLFCAAEMGTIFGCHILKSWIDTVIRTLRVRQ